MSKLTTETIRDRLKDINPWDLRITATGSLTCTTPIGRRHLNKWATTVPVAEVNVMIHLVRALINARAVSAGFIVQMLNTNGTVPSVRNQYGAAAAGCSPVIDLAKISKLPTPHVWSVLAQLPPDTYGWTMGTVKSTDAVARAVLLRLADVDSRNFFLWVEFEHLVITALNSVRAVQRYNRIPEED